MILASVAPHVVEQMRRLEFALMLVRSGESPREVRRLVRERFAISRVTAWRVVGMALDMSHD